MIRLLTVIFITKTQGVEILSRGPAKPSLGMIWSTRCYGVMV